MRHRVILCVPLLAIFLAGSVDLTACGDKFFRPGRGARDKRYGAIYPASILLYAPADTKAKTLKDFETALKGAGHTARSVRGIDGLASALSGGQYDIIIVAGSDAASLSAYLTGSPSPPEVVPMVDPKKIAVAEMQRRYPHVLTAGAARVEILEELDHVMSVRPRAKR